MMQVKNIFNYLRILKYIIKISKNKIYKNSHKSILLNTVRTLPVHLMLESLLAILLAKYTDRCYMLIDDAILKHWDTTQEFQNQKLNLYKQSLSNKMVTNIFRNFIFKILKANKVIVVKYSSLFEKSKLKELDLNKFKKYARSSTIRYFQTENINKEHLWYYNLSLQNAAISFEVASASEKLFSPDVILTSHGFYSTYGAFREYYKSIGKKVVIYESHPYSNGPQIILSEKIPQFFYDNEEWKEFEKKDLNIYEKEKILVYYNNERFGHKGWDTKIFYNNVKYRNNLNIDKSKTVFGCFPNIIWDANISERDYLFNGILDWLTTTIRFFINNKDKYLIIRFHPAEAKLWENSVSVESQVIELIPDLEKYENIQIIHANENIDTYNLIINDIDISIVYSGTLGMEIPLLGKPVISCAKSRYFKSGGQYHPGTKDVYLKWIKNSESFLKEWNKYKELKKEATMKFAYWMIYKSGYYFPAGIKNGIYQLLYKYLKDFNTNISENSRLKITLDRILFGYNNVK